TPTFTPSLTPTPTRTPTASPTYSPSPTPTVTPTSTPTNTPTSTPTSTPSRTPSITPTGSPTRTPTDTPTATLTPLPSLTPTVNPSASPAPSPTHSPTPLPDCSELAINTPEVSFEPPMASPGALIEISAPVHNVGWWDVNYTEVYFAYDGDPYNPDIEPVMIDMVVLEDIEVGSTKVATVYWDTTGLDSTSYPIYIATINSRPEECEPRYITLDYLVPVKLLSFEAQPGDGKVDLRWTTATEIENIGFHVYRSTSHSDNFEQITDHMLPGAGTSYTLNNYSYCDTTVRNSTPYFYRLASIDSRAEQEWSWVVSAVPGVTEWNIMVHTWTDRSTYDSTHGLSLTGHIENRGAEGTLLIQIALAFDEVYLGDLLPPTAITLPAGLNQTAELFTHEWDGSEPTGTYQFVTVLRDPVQDRLIAVEVTECRYLGD
ncbi:hypothetical protein JW905_04090, partial [bacterium]|nr:hypothetical protein [candidate division CSSED10-310 bacterium]